MTLLRTRTRALHPRASRRRWTGEQVLGCWGCWAPCRCGKLAAVAQSLSRVLLNEHLETYLPTPVCRPSGMGRSRRANAGSRLASLLRQEGGKAAYQQPESESEESQERDAWAQHGVVGWGGYGLAGGGGSSDSEGEGEREARGGGGWYSAEAAGREEAEEEEEEGQFDDLMDADYAVADVALERVRGCVLWLACHAVLLLLLCLPGWLWIETKCSSSAP